MVKRYQAICGRLNCRIAVHEHQEGALVMASDYEGLHAVIDANERALIAAADRIRSLEAELADVKADRDEWKSQHENLLTVKEHDNKALFEKFQSEHFVAKFMESNRDRLHEERLKLRRQVRTLEAECLAAKRDRNDECKLRQTAEAYAARNALRVIALQDALRKIVRDGDYTAPEGMKRIAQEALATELETLVDLKDPHNAHHPDRLKGPGLTAPETKAE